MIQFTFDHHSAPPLKKQTTNNLTWDHNNTSEQWTNTFNTCASHQPEFKVLCSAMLCYAMLCYAMLCYAMLSKPSSTLPVLEEKVLVVAGEDLGSSAECCSCCQGLMKVGRESLLSFAGTAARCSPVPQILRLVEPHVASLGLLEMQLAALHSLLGPEEEILRSVEWRWSGAPEDQTLGQLG